MADIKNIKGFSSAYPNMCDLKLLPNIDGTWITIQDNVGTSMTIKLSDLDDFMYCVLDKIRAEIELLSNANPSYWHSGDMVEREEVLEIIDKYKRESEAEHG